MFEEQGQNELLMTSTNVALCVAIAFNSDGSGCYKISLKKVSLWVSLCHQLVDSRHFSLQGDRFLTMVSPPLHNIFGSRCIMLLPLRVVVWLFRSFSFFTLSLTIFVSLTPPPFSVCVCSVGLDVGLCLHHHYQPAVPTGCNTGAHPQPGLLQVPAHIPGCPGCGHAQRRRPAPPAATCEYFWLHWPCDTSVSQPSNLHTSTNKFRDLFGLVHFLLCH